jgi:hypothetical protein
MADSVVEMTPQKTAPAAAEAAAAGAAAAAKAAPSTASEKSDGSAKPVNPTTELWRTRVENFTESNGVVAVMSMLTLWAMFNDDIRLVATEKGADAGFEAVISAAFFLFVLEIFAQSFYKAEYLYLPDWAPLPGESTWDTWIRRIQFGSFYFWLDWIATLSLVFEVCSRARAW